MDIDWNLLQEQLHHLESVLWKNINSLSDSEIDALDGIANMISDMLYEHQLSESMRE